MDCLRGLAFRSWYLLHQHKFIGYHLAKSPMEFLITSAEMLNYLCLKYMQLSTPCFVHGFTPAQPVPHIYPSTLLPEKFCLQVTSWYYQAPGRTTTRQPSTHMKWLLQSLPSMVIFYCHAMGCRVQLVWMDERGGTRLAGTALGDWTGWGKPCLVGVIKITWS